MSELIELLYQFRILCEDDPELQDTVVQKILIRRLNAIIALVTEKGDQK